MLKDREQLREFYNGLDGEYEGYIQMSDSQIKKDNIFTTPKRLPTWDSIHSNNNFILEMVLYEPEEKLSILVRQQNDKWVVRERNIKDEYIESYYTVIDDKLKIKVAHIYKEEVDEFCLGMEVLEPKEILFAGFEKDKR